MHFLFTEYVIRNILLRNINDLSRYHQTDNLPQERDQKYYFKLIRAINHSNTQFLLFGEKSIFNNNSDFFQQNDKNVIIKYTRHNTYFMNV